MSLEGRSEEDVLEEPEFLEKIKQGDPGAVDAMVVRYHPDVYRFLRHLSRHPQEAEDLAQATFLRAIARVETYAGKAPLRSWLLGIAYREFTRWRRRRLWLPLLGDRLSPGDPYSDLAEAEALLSALSRLPESLRATFLLHHVEELSIAEIAVSLDIPEGTVKSRLHTARARLRALLREEENYVPEAC